MDEDEILTTESINPNTVKIDSLSTTEILKVMNQEDKKITDAIGSVIQNISIVVDAVVDTIKNGGRVFFIGAGTSGRLGILEAAECPPTFGVNPQTFQAIIAGGEKAVFQSVESAEDDETQGKVDLQSKNITEKDIVIGIAASGRTPYVVGALKWAKGSGAKTVALTCNKQSVIGSIADFKIEAESGPEVVSGSTRMKAGSTQKIILNMITTTAMIKIGKVYQNLMVDLNISNTKLKDRAINIIKSITGVNNKVAVEKLASAQNNVKAAIVMIKNNVNYETALKKLDEAGGFVNKVIDEST